MRATAIIYHNIYDAQASGLCPVSIKVTFNRQRKYYRTGVAMSVVDFNKRRNLTQQLRDDFAFIGSVHHKANQVIKDLGDGFTFPLFEKAFLANKAGHNSVAGAFDSYISSMAADRVGNREVYGRAKVSLGKYKPNLKLQDLTPKLLHDYEKWMSGQGRSATTIGIYMRCLRTIFNELIATGTISKDLYPFGKRGYEIPTSKKTKKALSLEEVGKIFNYSVVPGSNLEMCRDLWIFIYLGNGINVSDLCRLRRSNIQDGTIRFVRQKTKRTKRNEEPIIISLNDALQNIIDKHGQKTIGRDPYIFPYLKDGQSVQEEIKAIKNLTWLINKYMKLLATEVGISKDITTYYARHSFATILKNSGAPVAMISQMLGHSSLATTQAYLDSFETEQMRRAASVLLDFNSKN